MFKRSLQEEQIKKNTTIDNLPKIIKRRSPTMRAGPELSRNGPGAEYKAGNFTS